MPHSAPSLPTGVGRSTRTRAEGRACRTAPRHCPDYNPRGRNTVLFAIYAMDSALLPFSPSLILIPLLLILGLLVLVALALYLRPFTVVG